MFMLRLLQGFSLLLWLCFAFGVYQFPVARKGEWLMEFSGNVCMQFLTIDAIRRRKLQLAKQD